jgi:hypothetical protein
MAAVVRLHCADNSTVKALLSELDEEWDVLVYISHLLKHACEVLSFVSLYMP